MFQDRRQARHHEATGVDGTGNDKMGVHQAQHHSDNATLDSAGLPRLVRDIALLDSDPALRSSPLRGLLGRELGRSHEWPRGVGSGLPTGLLAAVGQHGPGLQPGAEEEAAALRGGQRQHGDNPRQTSSGASELAHQWLEPPSAKQ